MTPESVKDFIGKVCEVEWLDHCTISDVKPYQRPKPFTMKTLGRIQNVDSVVIAGHSYYYLVIAHEEAECGMDSEIEHQVTVVMLDDVTWFQPYEVAA